MHPKKLIRSILVLAMSAQCGIVEAKRVDRRIAINTPAKRAPAPTNLKGRDLVNGLPVATGLETTGIYGRPTTALPGTGQHVVSAAPTSCMPGAANCAMPPAIQANMNPTPNQPMWPLLLQAGMGLLKPMFSGGSNSSRQASSRGGDSPARSPGSRDFDIPPPIRPPTVPGEEKKGDTRNTPAQPLGRILNGPCDPNRTGLQGILSDKVTDPSVSSIQDKNEVKMTTLKSASDKAISVHAASRGIVTVSSSEIAGKPDRTLCTKVVKFQTRDCLHCSMTVKFEVAKNPTGDAGVNVCQVRQSNVNACEPLVRVGRQTGVQEIQVSISDEGKNSHIQKFLNPETTVAEPRGEIPKPIPPPGSGCRSKTGQPCDPAGGRS